MISPVTAYFEAARALAGASSAVICGHVDPDGDAIGSVLGLTLALRHLGIDAAPTLADDREPPATYSFLPGMQLVRPASELTAAPMFVALDAPSYARLGVAEGLAREADTLVVIDHHPDNDGFGTVSVVEAGAAATGQMLWRMLPLLEIQPDQDVATCLYVALLTDTGRFQYGNSSAQVLRDAASMADAGAAIHDLYLRIYENARPEQLAIVARTLSRLTVANEGCVAYSWISDDDIAETGALPEETENLVDSIRSLAGPAAVFLVKCRDTQCRVSLRGKNGTDVGAIARLYGGGGHRAAAGFTYEGSLASLLPGLLGNLPGAGGR